MSGRDSTSPEIQRPVLEFADVTDAWVRASKHAMQSVRQANRAALAAWGFPEDDVEAGIESVAYERREWTTERTISTPGRVSVGDAVHFTKRLSDRDVRRFAEGSGDTNRLHLDDEFAAQSRFGNRIVHGTLVSGLVSAALARLPGLTIYLSQQVQFTKPVEIGDRVTAAVEIVEDIGDGRYRLTTTVVDEDDDECVTGEALVLIDPSPTPEDDDREQPTNE